MRKFNILAFACLTSALAANANAQLALPAGVEETVLAKSPFSTGLLTARDGALDTGIWQGAKVDDLIFLLRAAPTRPVTPAIGDGLRRVLLSSADAPLEASTELDGAKLMTLARLGFIEEARTIASLSSAPLSDPQVGQALAIADLSEDKLDDACARGQRITSGRDNPFWVKLRVVCYMAADETDAADLTLALLRESGALSLDEQVLFEALVTGAELKAPPKVHTAIDLAVRGLINAPVAPSVLEKADGGVVVSIARNEAVDLQLRLAAAVEAVALGIMPRSEFVALFDAISFEPKELADAQTAITRGPTKILNDAKIFQVVRQMQAPEFLRDKATLIAAALGAADSLPRAQALSTLYGPDIKALEGALLAPEEAGKFALANLALGDAAAASRWLNMMAGGGLSSLDEATAMEAIRLVNFLALMDPEAAIPVAASANVEILDPRAPGDSALDVNDETTARLVMSILDAATDRIEGQAALTAIAASDADGLANPLMRAIIDRALNIANVPDLAGRVRFETAWRDDFESSANVIYGASFGDAEEPLQAIPISAEEKAFGPRLKPSNN